MPGQRSIKSCVQCHTVGKIYGHGLCGKCYKKWLPPKTVRCKSCNETRVHEAKGMCRPCYDRAKHQRRYHQFGPQIRERNRRNHAKHRERYNLVSQEWYRSNRDYARSQGRIYYENNKDKYDAWRERRRTRLLAVPFTLTEEQWTAIQRAYGFRCAYCGTRPKRLTKDHVIPLSKGGGTTADNIVPACRSCNCSKRAKPPAIMPAIRLLL